MALAAPCLARADEDDSVTPYRPTVSTPARLSHPGWVEGEFGTQQAFDRSGADGSSQRSSIPYSIKYAFDDDWGVRLVGEGVVRTRADDGAHRTGVGDTAIVAKRRFGLGDDPDTGLGLEAGLSVPTARKVLQSGSGKPDWSINGIYSVQLADLHVDSNVVETRSGARVESDSRWQSLGAVAASYPLTGPIGVVGEIAGTRQHGTPSTAQFLGGFTWAVSRTCVVDVGTIHGLNRATPRWQAFAGVTVLLARLR